LILYFPVSTTKTTGTMRLTVTPMDDIPEEHLHDPAIRVRMFPEYRSKYLDDEIARNDLMRRFLKHGLGGYFITSDEEFAREEAKWRAAQAQDSHPTAASVRVNRAAQALIST